MAEKILVTSFKGGAGATTICVGLGLALGEMGEKTLIVDGDRLAASALIVAGLGNMQVYTLMDYERAACRAKQAAIPHPKCNKLHLMPCLGVTAEDTVLRAVEEVEGLYDFILLDKTAPNCADRAIVVTEPYLPSIKLAERARAALQDAGTDKISLAVNKLNGGQALAGEVYSAEAIANILRLETEMVIPDDMTLPVGRWKAGTVQAFKVAAERILGKTDGTYDVLKNYSGLNGIIKRKLRAKL